MRLRLFFCFMLLPFFLFAQPIHQMLHAHNDYKNIRPFWEAWEAGFGSIEVDLYWHKGNAFVAHDYTDLKKRMRLEQLYLEPIRKVLQQQGGRIYKADGARLILLIDIKNERDKMLEWLFETLLEYQDIFRADSGVTIALSGERPAPVTWGDFPPFVFIDGRPNDILTDVQWEKVALISASFEEVGRWKGRRPLLLKEKERFDEIIGFAKAHHKPLRFWSAPDHPQAWNFLLKAGVDIIGVDRVDAAFQYFKTYPEP